MPRVEGKVAIVTGGASGIGRMTCLVLAKEGAKVAVVDIDDAAGKKVVSEIEGSGGTAQFWHMDVTSAKEVEKTFADIYKAFGKINILVIPIILTTYFILIMTFVPPFRNVLMIQ